MMAESASNLSGAEPAAGDSRLGWRHILLLVAAVTLLRLLFIGWLSPYDLVGDEAQYWDWSRRLDLSYYSKGPGVAWLIALGTAIFGHTELGVRLPAVICGAIGAVAMAGVGVLATGGRRDVGFYAAAAFLLVPIFQAMALLVTIDGPYLTCWVLAALVAVWMDRRAAEARRVGPGPWALLGVVVGLGFLFKYTMLLLVPGLAAYGLWRYGHHLRRPRAWLGPLAGAAVAGLVASPVAVWNARHDWPTVRHLLGAVGLPGGDRPVGEPEPWTPVHLIEFTAAQVGLVGPFLLALSVAGVVWSLRRYRRGDPIADPWLMVLAAAPILLLYFGIAIFTKVQANWPMAGFITLLVPAAQLMAAALPRWRRQLAQWKALPRPRPRRGWIRRAPETPVQIGWHGALVYGLVAGIGFLALPVVAHLPLIGPLVPMHRMSGFEEAAAEVDHLRRDLREQMGREPLVIASHYHRTALMAFYLPGQPVTYCAAAWLGGRESSYDYFTDTDLSDPALTGRPVIFIGGTIERWHEAFDLRPLERAGFEVTGQPVFWSSAFNGLQAEGEPGAGPGA